MEKSIESIGKRPEELLEFFKECGIEVETFEHKPVYTVDEGVEVKAKIAGCHTKNLFLRDRKKRYYLVVMIGDKRLDIKGLGKSLEAKDLTFCKDHELEEILGTKAGHVSPFALYNNRPEAIEIILDEEMMGYGILNFHPLRNHMTTSISKEDFLFFLEKLGYAGKVVVLPTRS